MRRKLNGTLIQKKISALIVISALAAAQSYANDKADAFLSLSLEELGNIQITSVSKKRERLADAAGSIYVITAEAIKRSGVHTLPEALRLAPNLYVAQISGNQYAISARGLNSSTANKLLVLIDGRAIYTPLFSGVFWDAQDVLMQDIKRIEVISGPGGTLWGANAVNGVINIITKRPAEADGNLVHFLAGGHGEDVALRHASGFDEDRGAYRVYAKFDDWRDVVSRTGANSPDAWERGQIGFRTDWHDNGNQNKYTLQGDAYRGRANQASPGEQVINGANLLARWTKRWDDGSEFRVQGYFDRTTRDYPSLFGEKLNTFDLDAQYSMPEKEGSRLIFGGGYRVSHDQVSNSTLLAFYPAEIYLHWANLYAQQEQSFGKNWKLTYGAKVENNRYTGVELLPSAKLAWKFAENKLLWVDISRSVRTPSRLDTQLFAPATPPFLLAGGPDFRSEVANTINLGLRAQEGSALSYSIVAFHSRYPNLRSLNFLPDGSAVISNDIFGLVDGVETWGSYQLNKAWTFDASAQYLRERFSGPNLTLALPGNDPRWQLRFGSKWDINDSQHLNIAVRHVTKLPAPAVPAYTAVDVAYGWQLSKTLELMVIGRNIFEPHHQEFASGSTPILVERAFNVALTARF